MKRIIFIIIALLSISGFVILVSGYEQQASNKLPETINNAQTTAATPAATAALPLVNTSAAMFTTISTPAITPAIVPVVTDILPRDPEKLEDTAASNTPPVIPKVSNATDSAITVEPIKTSDNRIAEKIFTLVKSSDTSFEIYTELGEGKTQLITFNKKAWGTWNIGDWFYCDKKPLSAADYEHVAGGAGTDWEYVFRVGTTPTNAYNFSGGNHGKEELRSIKLIFDNVEKGLDDIKTGEAIKSNNLIIDELTVLASDDSLNNKYANVTRVYSILPAKVTLETHFEFISDIYMGCSYVCMFPISKSSGRFIKFNDSGNVFETPALGETLTTNESANYIGKEKTMSVQIWGDANPSRKFNVKIDNPGMVDNFNNSLKVFYWDFNKYTNKLYFSKFDSNNPQKISSGTKWDNKAEWEFEVDK